MATTNLSRFTKELQAMLPQWMRMAKDPDSVGAQFLNTFGLEFEDVQFYLDQVLSNQYIETADIGQIDVVYKVPLALPIISNLEEVTEVFGHVENDFVHRFDVVGTIREFYEADRYENTAILDKEEGVLYIRPSEGTMTLNLEKPMVSISISGAMHYEYNLHHIWNAFDEFGLILGIDRLFGERNAAFKERILDVFRKPANSTKQGLQNAISRELGVEDSEVNLNEFADKAFRKSLLNLDGSPTSKLTNYVNRINKVLGFTWDNMSWGEAYWRSIEEDQMGLEYIPHVWNPSTTGWKDTDFQSGIGDGNDLLVKAPTEQSNIREFDYFVGLRGMQRDTKEIHPEVEFKYKITANGIIPNEEYRQELYKYTIIASEAIKLNFIIRGWQQFEYTTKVDFDMTKPDAPSYRFDNNADPSIEIVTGNTVMSKADDRYLKVEVEMSKDVTAPKSNTPSVGKLDIGWRDSTGTVNTYSLDTQEDFTKNPIDDGSGTIDSRVDTEMYDVNIPASGAIELGFGDFYYRIDTVGSWREGAREHTEIVGPGTLKLKLPDPNNL